MISKIIYVRQVFFIFFLISFPISFLVVDVYLMNGKWNRYDLIAKNRLTFRAKDTHRFYKMLGQERAKTLSLLPRGQWRGEPRRICRGFCGTIGQDHKAWVYKAAIRCWVSNNFLKQKNVLLPRDGKETVGSFKYYSSTIWKCETYSTFLRFSIIEEKKNFIKHYKFCLRRLSKFERHYHITQSNEFHKFAETFFQWENYLFRISNKSFLS